MHLPIDFPYQTSHTLRKSRSQPHSSQPVDSYDQTISAERTFVHDAADTHYDPSLQFEHDGWDLPRTIPTYNQLCHIHDYKVAGRRRQRCQTHRGH